MTVFEEVNGSFPVRKTRAQKAAFRNKALEMSKSLGYEAVTEKGDYAVNVVCGNPDTASVVFSAHYDTPPRLPFPNICTPKNRLMFVLMQGAMALSIILAGVIAGLIMLLITRSFEISMLFADICLLAMSALMFFGPANPSCANDNTSGVCAVFEIMSRIPEDMRSKAAFVLFDNEEKGMLGSSAFKKKHPEVKNSRLLINLDCVGDGGYLMLLANKKTRALPEYNDLLSCLDKNKALTLVPCDMEKGAYPSDQSGFKLGIGVCTCLEGKRLGYYFDKIHTAKDTVCEQKNLDCIADGMSSFVKTL